MLLEEALCRLSFVEAPDRLDGLRETIKYIEFEELESGQLDCDSELLGRLQFLYRDFDPSLRIVYHYDTTLITLSSVW